MGDPDLIAFEQLRTFISRRMRMAHLYQLIEKGGWASLASIASYLSAGHTDV